MKREKDIEIKKLNKSETYLIETALEEQKKEKQSDQKLALKVVHEIKKSQFRPKAKFHPQKNIFAVREQTIV